jgi:hypothetical protein
MPDYSQNNTIMFLDQPVRSLEGLAPVEKVRFHPKPLRKTLFSLLLLNFFSLTLMADPALTQNQERSKEDGLESQPFSDLNLRFSNKAIKPPDALIVKSIPLIGISVAKPFVAPVPQAVIFEDDRRQRVAVLSTDGADALTLFLLEHLPLDTKLSALVQCADHRGCETDRTPLTGGLGCLALCIKDLLELSALNQ